MLSLDERRRRRKAELQRQLMEESQRAEEELRASQQQSQQQQSEEEEEKEPRRRSKKKRKLKEERSLLDSSSSDSSCSSSSNSNNNDASPAVLLGSSWNQKKSAATDNNAAAATTATGQRQRLLLQSSPSTTPGLCRLSGVSSTLLMDDASPQSSVSMSQPLHNNTKLNYSVSSSSPAQRFQMKTTTTTTTTTTAMTTTTAKQQSNNTSKVLGRDQPPWRQQQQQGASCTASAFAAAARRKHHSRSCSNDSSSSDDSLPNNMAKFQKLQAKAKLLQEQQQQQQESGGNGNGATTTTMTLNSHQNSNTAHIGRNNNNNSAAAANNNSYNNSMQMKDPPPVQGVVDKPCSNNNPSSVAAAYPTVLASSHVTKQISSAGSGSNYYNNKRPWPGRGVVEQQQQQSKKKNPTTTTKPWAGRQQQRHSRSDSTSSDDSLPNNMALFYQKKTAAAAELAETDATTTTTTAVNNEDPKEEKAPTSLEKQDNNNNCNAPAAAVQQINKQNSSNITAEMTCKPTKENQATSSSSSPSVEMETPWPPPAKTKTHTPKNPLARMKEEARQFATVTTTRTTTTAHTESSSPAAALNKEDYARLLDEDDDEEEEQQQQQQEEEDKKKTKEKKKGKKKASSDSSSSFAWKSTPSVVVTNNSPAAFLESIEGRDEDELCNEYKPQFRDNQVLFQPHALDPIKLQVQMVTTTTGDANNNVAQEETNGNGQQQQQQEYEIPGSMARYMYDFQHEGIRFIFNAIMKHHGAILGDDMGLGKTIQTIGLLAALLRKKGTGADLLELHRRAQMTEGIKRKAEEAKQKALGSGELYMPTSPSLSVQQPEWGPVLILAPSAVCKSWMTSFKVWGHFSTTEFESKDSLENIRLGSVEILVASHNRIQEADTFACLREIHWKLVIIDEFHVFKSEKAIKTKNLRLLRDDHSAVILGLSGTCMQNDHKELWNLFDIISKGYLGPWRDFQNKFAKPIKIARTKDGNPTAVQLGFEAAEELSSKLFQILIERKKEEVLKDDLPSKDERIVFCELSPLQKKIYQYIVGKPDFVFLKHASSPCDCGINQKFFHDLRQLSSDEERIEYRRRHKDELMTKASCCYKVPETFRGSGEIHPEAFLWRRQHENGQQCGFCPFCISFSAMSMLIKLSSHVGLIQPKDKSDKEYETKLELAKAFIPKEVINKDGLPSYDLTDSIMDDHGNLSGKMAVLARLLQTIDEKGGRVLIFSAYTQSLDLLENYVMRSGYSYLRMDGTTPRHKRQELADEFNNSPGILLFLLSTKAMGLGLNLTSANFVIIFDAEWNPSWDSQAQDRSYRIGQKRDVTVFRLVSQGTLEEQKYLRQVYKTQLKKETMVDVANPERERAARLFRGVANDPSRRGELFGLSNLLRFEEGGLWKNGAEAKGFGRVDTHSVESIVEAAKKTLPADEDWEEISLGVPDIAKRNEKIDTEAKGGAESDSEDEMMGAESQAVLEMCDKDGDALAGNDVNTTSDGGPTENDVVADSVPSLATSAAAAATGAGGDIAPTTAITSTAIKREMDDSPPPDNASSMAMAKLPEVSSLSKLGPAASTEVVKHEMDDSPTTLGNNESSKAMAKVKSSTIEGGGGGSCMAPPAAAVNPVVVVKHEMVYDSPTTTTSGDTSSTKAARAATIPIMPKSSVEQVYCMRNVQLAGKSTNHIREGQTKTTFSIYDFGFSSETV